MPRRFISSTRILARSSSRSALGEQASFSGSLVVQTLAYRSSLSYALICHSSSQAFRNAMYAFLASKISALLVTSIGACMLSTATPASTTFIAYAAEI